MTQRYHDLTGEDLELYLQDKRHRARTGTPESQRFTGPCDYTYRGFRVVLVYVPAVPNPYGGVVVPPGGKPEELCPHFLEEQVRREAQHIIDGKLEPRVISEAENAAMDELHGPMAETDR